MEELINDIDLCLKEEKFKKAWRVKERREYKIIREEMMPIYWFMKHAKLDDRVIFCLTKKNDPNWDATFKFPGRENLNLQVTLAYCNTSFLTEKGGWGREDLSRMEQLNESGKAPAFGRVWRNRGKIMSEGVGISKSQLIASYACGVRRSLNRKANHTGSDGELLIFIEFWMPDFGCDVLEDILSGVSFESALKNFRKVHIITGKDAVYKTIPAV